MITYQCSYFGTEQGRYPVEEFIDNIDEGAQRKFVYKRSMLENLGPRLMEPHAKSVDEHLREKSKDPLFRELFELEEEKAKIASLIVKYRADHHMNQGQLARKVRVTQQYISKIEEGNFSSLSTVWRILHVLGYRISLRVFPFDPRAKHTFQRAA